MSLEKGIKHGKEHRKDYYGIQAFDPYCRCHGNCGFCRESRLRRYRIAEISFREQIKELGNY